MKIGVLSDTHLRHPNPALDIILAEMFKDVDMILHAGDIVSAKVLQYLELHRVIAVCGNMDDYEVAGMAPQERIISAGDKKIGLVHGWGSREGLENRIITRFHEKPDIIVYGHSHVPFWGSVDGVRMFNPGSASQNRSGAKPTVGILEIASGEFFAHILDAPNPKNR